MALQPPWIGREATHCDGHELQLIGGVAVPAHGLAICRCGAQSWMREALPGSPNSHIPWGEKFVWPTPEVLAAFWEEHLEPQPRDAADFLHQTLNPPK